jgi:hypothetical protein
MQWGRKMNDATNAAAEVSPLRSTIFRLRAALEEAMLYNWSPANDPPPVATVVRCEAALGVTEEVLAD